MPSDNQLFMAFCCGAYFILRIDWHGDLLASPNPRAIPTRTPLLYYALREVSILRRFIE